tara:strand:+ start:198 stop:503 length:306 start_codon:yes stop_codon:yes gene_type:complete
MTINLSTVIDQYKDSVSLTDVKQLRKDKQDSINSALYKLVGVLSDAKDRKVFHTIHSDVMNAYLIVINAVGQLIELEKATDETLSKEVVERKLSIDINKVI